MSAVKTAAHALGNGGGNTIAVYRLLVAALSLTVTIIGALVWRGLDRIEGTLESQVSIVSNVRVEQSRQETRITHLQELIEALTRDRYTGSQAQRDWLQQDRRDNLQEDDINDHESRLRAGGL